MSETKRCPFCDEEIRINALKCKHCGSMLSDDPSSGGVGMTALKQTMAGKYEILGEIGRGGMATVYKARQINLDRIVALKVLPPQFTHDMEFVKRFQDEARNAARVSHHNLIAIHDVGSEQNLYYISMEFLSGETLRDRILREGALPEAEIRRIITPIADGLSHAHEQNLIHRDIKSSNIFLTDKGRPVLMDFGIAKALDSTQKMTQSGTVLGTPEYMSPEQAQGKTTDARSDIYSLGIVMYEMATGRLPFQGDHPLSTLHLITTQPPTPPKGINTNVSEELQARILKCLEKEPGKRFQSATVIFIDSIEPTPIRNSIIEREQHIETAEKPQDKTPLEVPELVHRESSLPRHKKMESRFLRRAIFALSVLILLLTGFLTTIYFEKKIKDNISEILVESMEELAMDLKYSDLSVSLIKGKLLSQEIIITDKYNEETIQINSIIINFPLATAFELMFDMLKYSSIKSVKSCNLDLNEINYSSKRDNIKAGLRNLAVIYNGDISIDEFKDREHNLPIDKQMITIILKGFDLSSPEIDRIFENNKVKRDELANFGICELVAVFDPDRRMLVCEKFLLDNSLITLNINALMNYKGLSFEELTISQISCRIDLNLKKGFEIGNEMESGRFRLEQLNLILNPKFLFSTAYKNGYMIDELSGNIQANNFTFNIDGYGKRRFERNMESEVKAIGLSNLEINSFNLDFIYAERNLTINHVDLESPILNAKLVGNIQINIRDTDDSIIKNAVLTFSNVSRNCNQLIRGLESEIRKPLPRDNNGNIVFEFYGTLGNPLIKGVTG